jgi:hypothetical protein
MKYVNFFSKDKQTNFIFSLEGSIKVSQPSFGLATKAKGLQECGPKESPRVTSHTPGSVESVRE